MSNEDLKFGATDHWTVLRGGGYQGGGLAISTFPTGVYGDSGQVRLAVGPASEPRVLLPLADQEVANRSPWGQCAYHRAIFV